MSDRQPTDDSEKGSDSTVRLDQLESSRGETDSSRRSFLQTGGILGSTLLGFGGLTTSASANRRPQDADELAVEGTTEVSSTVAAQERIQAQSSTVVGKLGEEIASRHDLEHWSDYALEVTTNDPELNRANPRVVFSGYGPKTETNQALFEDAGAAADDRVAGGVVVTLTADVAEANGQTNRQPVTAFAATTESKVNDESADLRSSRRRHGDSDLLRKMYSVDGSGDVSVEHVDSVKSPDISQAGADEVTAQNDGIDAICASGCTAIVGAICDRATGTVSKYLCVKVCTPLISSVYGYAACAAGCVILVDVINNKGCYVGAAGICAEVC